MEERSLRELPHIEDLIACIAGEEDVFMVHEDLVSRKRSIVAWGSRNFVSGSSVEVLERVRSVLRGFGNRGEQVGLSKALFGYVSYDAVRLWERVKDLRPYSEPWPYFEFFEPENVVVYDYASNKAILEVVDDKKLGCRGRVVEPLYTKFYDAMLSGREFEDAVSRVLEYIREGYAFQVVLSRFERYTIKGDSVNLYLALRDINPSPYMYFTRFWRRSLIGSSPELLFSINGTVVETYPIAGTRPRGRSIEEDRRLEEELLSSEKDRAEHLMLVDLARNDLGKISSPGSVEVVKLMYIEKYSHVQHIVSKIIGTLRKRLDFTDALKALLPAGTVSGAPKPFAMNLIEELEHYKRGPYAGAIGYATSVNRGEMAIIIRSAFIHGDVLRIQAGAGIVYNSKPSLELEETEHKLASLKEAMRKAAKPAR
jgi:anthranilate synthase component 1